MAVHWPNVVPNLTILYPGVTFPGMHHLGNRTTTTTPFPTIKTTKFKGHHKTTTARPTLPTINFLIPEEDLFSTTPAPLDVSTGDLTWDDATWILINSFIIFTMQTGFGLLESGCCSIKNETHILMKNVVDIVCGGLTYWIFGFSLSYGAASGSSWFAGVGEYVVDASYDLLGPVMTTYFFQLSFATTSTTIVSGTMAERCNFKSYCLFSLVNTIVYSIPARWVWGSSGWLNALGCIDIAGSGAVHLLGGASGYAAAWMLGPRLGRYENGTDPVPLGNPLNCIFGMFVLWWGWPAFNAGSTFGVVGDKWKFAARAAATTMIAAIVGGVTGSAWSFARPGKIFDVMDIVNPILGSLVGITAGCALYHTFDAVVVGMVGAIVVIATAGFADYTRVDDPVGATAVHGFAGIWGLVAVGLFAEDDQGAGFSRGNAGLFRGGSFYLLGVQVLASVCIIVWAIISTVVILWVIDKIIPIRMEPYEELLGADYVEHLLRRKGVGITPIWSAMGSHPDLKVVKDKAVVIRQNNPTHDTILNTINEINGARRWKKLQNAVTTMTVTSAMSRKTLKQNQIENYISNEFFNASKFEEVGLSSTVLELENRYSVMLGAPVVIQKQFKMESNGNFLI